MIEKGNPVTPAHHREQSAPAGGSEYTIGQAAALLGVSIRTLRHWDEQGIAVPSGRTWSGYRVYSTEDMQRLHRVLVYRETGMPLAKIREVVGADGPSREHLQRQREALMKKVDHLRRMIDAVDSLMERESMNEQLTPEKRAEILGTDWDPQFEVEAEEKYGDTDDWREAQRRQAAMSTGDFEQATARMREVESRLAKAVREGVDPGSDRAAALAEEHRLSLVWFDVTPAKHVLIAKGYTADPRFRSHFEKVEPGLAEWLQAAISANARAHGVDPDAAEWE